MISKKSGAAGSKPRTGGKKIRILWAGFCAALAVILTYFVPTVNQFATRIVDGAIAIFSNSQLEVEGKCHRKFKGENKNQLVDEYTLILTNDAILPVEQTEIGVNFWRTAGDVGADTDLRQWESDPNATFVFKKQDKASVVGILENLPPKSKIDIHLTDVNLSSEAAAYTLTASVKNVNWPSRRVQFSCIPE